MSERDVIVERRDGVMVMTIDREDKGNMLRRQTTLELAEALRELRDDPKLAVGIITGAGDKFFCIGGEHDETEARDYSAVLPVVDVYELIDTVPKPVLAAVNGYAVGGGHVMQVMCDLSVAAESAVFRQVGPMVGSFDAGFGTWYLEATIGRKRAKEMWYLNPKLSADQALEIGLVNEVVPTGKALERAEEVARELMQRGPGALAALKSAFAGRHLGALGASRVGHDQLLTHYLTSEEAHELSAAFRERRPPDRDRFNR
ncbi:MAG TPA: enoyl-CoA hydratase-related protein [Solirubrobacterales bacterium]|nr:enoyl-CoA hydratase-related protein [Solirubrobacterales bacterium]